MLGIDSMLLSESRDGRYIARPLTLQCIRDPRLVSVEVSDTQLARDSRTGLGGGISCKRYRPRRRWRRNLWICCLVCGPGSRYAPIFRSLVADQVLRSDIIPHWITLECHGGAAGLRCCGRFHSQHGCKKAVPGMPIARQCIRDIDCLACQEQLRNQARLGKKSSQNTYLHAVRRESCHAQDGGCPTLCLATFQLLREGLPTVATLIADAPNAERALAIRKSAFLVYVWVEIS